jgi:hypothetical protein
MNSTLARVVFAVWVLAATSVTCGEEARTLQWKFSKGRKLVYDCVQSGTLDPGNGKSEKVEASTKITLVCCEDGTALVRTNVGKASATGKKGSAAEALILATQFAPLILDANGTVRCQVPREVKNLPLMEFPLPTAPVKQGQSWKPDIVLAEGNKPPTESECSISSVEDKDGSLTAVITTKCTCQAPTGSMSVAGKHSFDIKRGCFTSGTVETASMLSPPTGSGGSTTGMSTRMEIALAEDVTLEGEELEKETRYYEAFKRIYEAHRLIRERKLDEAIAELRQAIKIKEDVEAANVLLVQVLAVRGRYEEAIACVKQEMKFRPGGEGEKVALAALADAIEGIRDADQKDLWVKRVKAEFPESFE